MLGDFELIEWVELVWNLEIYVFYNIGSSGNNLKKNAMLS